MTAANDPGPQLRTTLVRLGVDAQGVTDLVAELSERHREWHRRFHTWEHVREVLAEAGRLGATLRPDERTAVELAAHFHDAIYDVRAEGGESEAASAALARERLTALGVDEPQVAEVERLILLTAGHAVEPGDRTGAVLVDSDLWILTSEWSRYERYAGTVREEYSHVGDDLWAVGRGAVLDKFLAMSGELFQAGDPADAAMRRDLAITNLTRERAALVA